MGRDELIAFEKRVYVEFEEKRVKGPIHLSGGSESQLIEIFKDVRRDDWVFSTYRSHYHALLHGIDPEWLFAEILAGRSMNIMSSKHRFFTSAIVGGCLPIAVGVAAALKRVGSPSKVWCFVGDMAATTGAFMECYNYVRFQSLPLTFVLEDNGMSCDSPTAACWGGRYIQDGSNVHYYQYKRVYPHVGIGRNVF